MHIYGLLQKERFIMGKTAKHQRQQQDIDVGLQFPPQVEAFGGNSHDDQLILDEEEDEGYQGPSSGATNDDIMKALLGHTKRFNRLDRNVGATAKAVNRVQNQVNGLNGRVGQLENMVMEAGKGLGRMHLEQAKQWKNLSKKEKKKVSKHYEKVASARKSKLEKAIDKVGDNPVVKGAALAGLGWLGWKAGKAAYGFLTGDAGMAADGMTE